MNWIIYQKISIISILPHYRYVLSAVFKYRNLLDLIPFKDWLDYPITMLLTSRGCNYNCAIICGGSRAAYKTIYNRDEPAFRSPDKLVADIKLVSMLSKAPIIIIHDIRHGGAEYARIFWEKLSAGKVKNEIIFSLLLLPVSYILLLALGWFLLIYLDNAATSWPKPETVYRAMDKFLREQGANPGRAAFRMALAAENEIKETRVLLQKLFNAPSPDRIIFTHNCTDALNMALKGLLGPGDHVITGNLEHNSVSRPLNGLAERGVQYSRVQHHADGTIDPGEIEKMIRPHTKLIVLAHASNVMGTVQRLQEIGELAARHNIFFLVDGAQTAGVIPLNLQAMSIDMLACPGHKALLGPPGTGLLVLGDRVELKAWREGGTGSESEEPFHPLKYPDHLEGGTPNTTGIAGLKAGVEFILEKGLEKIREHELMLLEKLLSGLGKIPGINIYGSLEATKRIGLVTFNLEGWEPQNLSAVLDAGFELACRSGLHCAPWAHEAINTLPAGAVRFSLGFFNTEAEIETAVAAVAELANTTS